MGKPEPLWASPDTVNGAHPGSRVESNMSPPAKCSTRKPVGIMPVVDQLGARMGRQLVVLKSSEGQCLFGTRLFEAGDVLESADRQT